MGELSTREALLRALHMDPSRIGVGRLCQELLSEISGLPITAPLIPGEPLFSIKNIKMINKPPLNPYGRRGKPKVGHDEHS